MTSRSMPIPMSNVSRNIVGCCRVLQVVARAPGMGRVEAEADMRAPDAACRDRIGDVRQLLDRRAQPEPAPGRVLEHEHRGLGRAVDLLHDVGDAVGDAASAGGDATSPMRADVDVDVSSPKAWSRPELVGQHRDGPIPEIGVRAGEVDQIGGVDCQRGDAVDVETGPEGGLLARRVRTPSPRRGVVGEDLDRLGADLVRPLCRLDHPGAEGNVGAKASSIGQHRPHRTMRNLFGKAPRGRGGFSSLGRTG